MKNIKLVVPLAFILIFSGCANLKPLSSSGLAVDDSHSSWHKRYYFETLGYCKKQNTMSIVNCMIDKKYVIDGVGSHPHDLAERTRITANLRLAEKAGALDNIELASLSSNINNRIVQTSRDRWSNITNYRPIIDLSTSEIKDENQLDHDMSECLNLVRGLYVPRNTGSSLAGGAIIGAGIGAALGAVLGGTSSFLSAGDMAARGAAIGGTAGVIRGGADAANQNPYARQNEGLARCMMSRGYTVLG